MSMLFPLYALAALGIAAPVLFHLFQRKPVGQRDFSSLLFLAPTPPKVTSRSRISDWLLLLCRALILGLLALAFARPFMRSASLLDVEAPSRSVVLLVDTSASMRRDGMWEEMQSRIKSVIDDLRPVDDVALMRFDREAKLEMSFEAWQEQAESMRLDWLQKQAAALEPTWQRTDLGAALIYASDVLLGQVADQEETQSKRPMQVVVFSDTQEGSDLSALQSYQWPSDVSVDLKVVAARARSNASLQWLPADIEEQDNERIRVLVRNEADSQEAQFELAWEGDSDTAANGSTDESSAYSTHVPPGQTRVVKLKQPADSFRLKLMGDDQSFDNTAYIPATKAYEQELWYVGEDSQKQDSLLFFLKQSPLDTRHRSVELKIINQLSALATVSPDKVPLIVLDNTLNDSVADLRRYMSQGGRVLVVLKSDLIPAESGAFLSGLTEIENIQIKDIESEDKSDYAMLAEVDFASPLLQPFADARYNDFTKIRFWSHRSVTAPDDADWKTIARFDDDSPALMQKAIDKGQLWILTSGWHPSESQLSLSTKFVPLMHGFFGDVSAATLAPERFEVGDSIPLRFDEAGAVTIVGPNAAPIELDSDAKTFSDANEPGLYEFKQGDDSYKIAVNLAREESRTNAMLPGRFEQLGVALGEQKTVETTETEQRQMRNKELESRQKFWRWGVIGALCLIAGETWLSRSRSEQQPATSPEPAASAN